MQQDDSQLVIRDVPIIQWILGILFAGIGTLVINQGGPPVFGTIFAAIGVSFLLFSSVLIITANRMTRTLKLDYRSALRHTWKQVPFDEIAGINVERRVSPKRGFYIPADFIAEGRAGNPIPVVQFQRLEGEGAACRPTARISRDSGFQPHPRRDPASGAVAGS